MEIDHFQKLLLCTLDNSECASEVVNVIKRLAETNYPSYIDLLLDSVLNIINPRIPPIAITWLYHEVRTKNIFTDYELSIQFLQKFANNISDILTATTIPDNFKMMMSMILGLLHAYIFGINKNVTIPNYILTSYTEHPELRRFLMNCVFEIVVASSNFGGFSIEDLMKILDSYQDDLSLFIPRTHLFFAIAKIMPDVPALHEFFPYIFTHIPPSEMDNFLLSFSEFAEHSAYFFEPYLPPVVMKLCGIAINSDEKESLRNKAIICLGSIAQGAPELCQSTESYFVPVIQTMIQIASEVNDNSPWEYDPNNSEPYQVALDTLGHIFHAMECPYIFCPFSQIINSVISLPNVKWQGIFAVFSAAAELDPCTLSFLYDRKNEQIKIQFLELIAHFLTLECHPRVRCAVYSLVAKMSPVLNPENKCHSIIILPLREMIKTENILIAKKFAFIAMIEFLSQSTCDKNIKYLDSLFPFLVEELIKEQEEEILKVYILRCMGYLMKAAREDALNYFSTILKLTISLLQSNNHLVCAEAIRCFSLASHYIQSNDKLIRCYTYFFTNALILLNVEQLKEEETLDGLYNSIHFLIKKMKGNIEPFVPEILPKILQEVQKPVTIDESDVISENYYLNSMYIKIPSENSTNKLYASHSEVDEVFHYLHILDALIISDPNVGLYIEQVVEIINYWIFNQYSIEKLKSICWDIIESLIRINILDRMPQFIEFIFHCFINSVEKKGSPLYIKKMFNIIIETMRKAASSNWDSIEIFSSLLQSLPGLFESIIEKKSKKVQKLAYYNNLTIFNKEISNYDSVLTKITEFIKVCFKIQPGITCQFYNQVIKPKVNIYLQNPVTKIFGISMATTYHIGTKDQEKVYDFMDYLVSNCFNFDRQKDLVLTCFSSLGELFENFPLFDEQMVNKYLSFFINLYEHDEFENDTETMIIISDFANIAYAKFLAMNIEKLDISIAISSFYDAFPLWEKPVDSDKYFSFIATAIERGWINYISNDWPEHILCYIISGWVKKQYKESTRARFAISLRNYMRTEHGNNVIEKALGRMNTNKSSIFNELVYLP